MIYELWHIGGGSIIGAYDNESDALRVVREAALRHGLDYLDAVALLQDDAQGQVKTIAEGADLAKRAGIAETMTVLRAP